MSQQEHILVLRFSALGDVAMLVPVLREVFKTYPDVKITLLSREKMKPLFEEFKAVDFFPFDPRKHRGILGLWKLFFALKKQHIMAVADLHYVLRSRVLSLFFIFSGIKVKHLNKNRRARRELINTKKKDLKPLGSIHNCYAQIFDNLGYPIDLSQHRYPKSPFRKPTAIIEGFKVEKRKWIGIAPFAAHLGKRYPLDLMQKVVSYLQQEHDVFLLGGGIEEEKQLMLWASAYKNAHSITNFSFNRQLKLIAHLDVMLSMDSANGHIAANFNIPVITLWGMTHPYAGFKPFNQPEENQITLNRNRYPKIPTSIYGNKIPIGYEEAFRSIAPKEIIEKVLWVLNLKET